MPSPAFQLLDLRGILDERPLGEGRLRLRLERCLVRASAEGIGRLIPARLPVRLEKVSAYGVLLRVEVALVSALAEVRLTATPEGGLGLELAAVHTELLPLPVSLVAAALREFLPPQPWLLQRPGARWEIDFRELLRPYGVEPPPLVHVSESGGVLELRFARPQPGETSIGGIEEEPEWAAPPLPRAPGGEAAPAGNSRLVREEIEAQFPATLGAPEAPAPGQPPVRLGFRVRNPAGSGLRVEFQGRPWWVTVEPALLLLEPGGEQGVAVRFDPGQVTRENHREAEVTAAWSIPGGAIGAGSPWGRALIRLEIPPPRRLFLCPNPRCEQILYAGEPVCRHCGAALRYCPQCGAPAVEGAARCSGPDRHPLS